MNKTYEVSSDRSNYQLKNIPIYIEENIKMEDYFEYYYPNTLVLSMDSILCEYLYYYDVSNCENVSAKISQIFNKHGFYYEFGSNWYLYAVPLARESRIQNENNRKEIS